MIKPIRPGDPKKKTSALEKLVYSPPEPKNSVPVRAFDIGRVLEVARKEEEKKTLRIGNFRIGIETKQAFQLTDFQVGAHMAVLGGSGGGKSKFLELFLRQCLLKGKPFGLWDPHGDLARSLMAFVAAQKALGNDELWRKMHYLELTPECIFSFDPVARAPLRTDVGDYTYYQWLRVRVAKFVKVFLRRVAEANQDVMVRLKRWLRCVLYACLVAIDDKNTHVGLDKAIFFTDPQCDEFREYYPLVA